MVKFSKREDYTAIISLVNDLLGVEWNIDFSVIKNKFPLYINFCPITQYEWYGTIIYPERLELYYELFKESACDTVFTLDDSNGIEHFLLEYAREHHWHLEKEIQLK